MEFKLEVDSTSAVMLTPQHSPATILLLSGTLAFISVGCSSVEHISRPLNLPEQTSPATNKAENPPRAIEPVATTTEPQLTSTVADPYEWALDAAQSANSISQSAQSADDWNLVVSRWLEAINFLKTVPTSSPYYAIAKTKINDYQRNLTYAQQQVMQASIRAKSPTVVAQSPNIRRSPSIYSPSASIATPELAAPGSESTSLASTRQVVSTRIKRRAAGTPVIEVTFNGKHTFDMVVDTGASNTVITSDMALALGVRSDTVLIADTASAKRVKFGAGKVSSVAVEGAVAKNLKVAIAGSGLNTGLLGQDFFGKYDLLIKRDVVEFHPREEGASG